MSYESIVCPACLPEKYRHKSHKMRGFWDIDYSRNIAKCSNCGYERIFTPRKKRNDYITPTQQKVINRIKHYFQDWQEYDKAYKHPELYKFEIELTDYGTVFVSVQDVEDYLICEGGFFSIGRRGALKVHNNYGLGYEGKKEHYAYMLGGKVE